MTKYFFNKNLNITGIDISEKCIQIASALHPQISFEVMDMADLSLYNESVDGLIAYYSIIHAPKKDVHFFFREFQRVLKPHGKLMVVVKGGEEEGLINPFLDFNTDINFTHFQHYEIRNFFQDHGFRILYEKERNPYEDEIQVSRIYMIGERI